MTLATEIASSLYEIKAVQIKSDCSFTWTSGIKSPIYCDNRLTLAYPAIRKKICKGFVESIKQLKLQPDVIAGCATAGIPHAAWLAEQLELPMAYVRGKAKAHGKGNQIEGRIESGQKVIVIEDLISTGGSALEAVRAIQAIGAEVVSVLAIFSYGLTKAQQAFAKVGVPCYTLTDFDQLIHFLKLNQTLTPEEGVQLLSWRDQLGQ